MSAEKLIPSTDELALREEDVCSDPLSQFRLWFDEAVRVEAALPEAMTLATATADGKPSARMVLLRGCDERGFVFFTNYDSRKASELDANPQAALVFFWRQLDRQVRVEGRIERVSAEESDRYFRSRPRGNRLSAWASPQSQVIPDREFLEARMREQLNASPGAEVTRPENWGGYRVMPEVIEFWQGRQDRLHDRLRYRWHGNSWLLERLAP